MPVFVGYSLSVGFTGAAFQAFLAGAPVVLIVLMGVRPEALGFYILSVPIAYVAGNYVASRLSYRVGRQKMIWIGCGLTITGTMLLVALSLAGLDTPFTGHDGRRGPGPRTLVRLYTLEAAWI